MTHFRPRLLIKNGTLIDGSGCDPVPNTLVVVEGNRIAHGGPADGRLRPESPDDTVIDAAGNLYVSNLGDGIENRVTFPANDVFVEFEMNLLRDPDLAVGAVCGPAGKLVEAACPRVVAQDPENRIPVSEAPHFANRLPHDMEDPLSDDVHT